MSSKYSYPLQADVRLVRFLVQKLCVLKAWARFENLGDMVLASTFGWLPLQVALHGVTFVVH